MRYCRPLPRGKQDEEWKGSGHAGLWYEKLGGTWKRSGKGQLTLKAEPREEPPKLEWIRSVTRQRDERGKFRDQKIGDRELLKEQVARQQRMAKAVGGRVVRLENRSTFVTGIGVSHPLENGFLWHPSLGVPYLPGSGIKGVLRSWLRGGGPELVSKAAQHDLGTSPRGAPPEDNPGMPSEDEIDRLLGTNVSAGSLEFLPMLPTKPMKLLADLVNPHRRKDDVADWNDPVPSFFLSVGTSTQWQLAILPSGRLDEPKQALDRVEAWLLQAADWAGFGAKTNAGYGRFRAMRSKGKR